MLAGCIVDGQSARIGHRGEVAVVGGADPARARRIGAKLARPQRADQRRVRCRRPDRARSCCLRPRSIRGRTPDPAASARRSRDRRIPPDAHRRRSCGRCRGWRTAARPRSAPAPSCAAGTSLSTKSVTFFSRGPSALNAGWMSRPSRPPGQGASPCHRRMAVGDVDDAGQVAADQRLQRVAQLGEVAGKFAVEHGPAPAARWRAGRPG